MFRPLVGTARMSTKEQNLNLQRNAPTAAECSYTFDNCSRSDLAKVLPGLKNAFAIQ